MTLSAALSVNDSELKVLPSLPSVSRGGGDVSAPFSSPMTLGHSARQRRPPASPRVTVDDLVTEQ